MGLEVDMEIGDRLYFCIWSFFVGVGGGFIGEGGLDGDCVGSWWIWVVGYLVYLKGKGLYIWVRFCFVLFKGYWVGFDYSGGESCRMWVDFYWNSGLLGMWVVIVRSYLKE